MANKKLISKLFVRHSSGDNHRNKGKENSIDFLIKLDEDKKLYTILLKSKAGNTSFLIAGRSGRNVKITRCSTAKKHFSTLALILFSSPTNGVPNQGK